MISTYTDLTYRVLFNEFTGNTLRYKIDFAYKVYHKYLFLKNNVNIKDFDIVIAATLFSEGAVANKIYEDYKIPYIVSVRGTDMNLYIRRLIHLWPLGRKVINHSAGIVYLTEIIKVNFMSSLFFRLMKVNINKKTCVIYNGIDQLWLDNVCLVKRENLNKNILYIGRFDANKNVERLQRAVLILSKDIPGIHLTLIGGGGDRSDSVIKLSVEYPELFSFLGRINDRKELIKIMRQHGIFAMISHNETFGLVYVEALSQGLSILYTKGQGIDGVFAEHVGESVVSSDLGGIIFALKKLILDYNNYTILSKDTIKIFSWSNISRKYIDLINSSLKK